MWKSPEGAAGYQLDYTTIKQRYRNSVKDLRFIWRADADTGHTLVIMKALIKLKLIMRNSKIRQRWNKKRNLEEKNNELGQNNR